MAPGHPQAPPAASNAKPRRLGPSLTRLRAAAFMESTVAQSLASAAEPDVVRLLTEALEHAWLDGADR